MFLSRDARACERRNLTKAARDVDVVEGAQVFARSKRNAAKTLFRG